MIVRSRPYHFYCSILFREAYSILWLKEKAEIGMTERKRQNYPLGSSLTQVSVLSHELSSMSYEEYLRLNKAVHIKMLEIWLEMKNKHWKKYQAA